MGVVRLSSSGLQVQFVDDAGNVFVTSKKFLLGFLGRGGVSGKPLVLSRLPFGLSPDRYGVSPLASFGGGVVQDLGIKSVSSGSGVVGDVSGRVQAEKRVIGDVVDLSVEVDLE